MGPGGLLFWVVHLQAQSFFAGPNSGSHLETGLSRRGRDFKGPNNLAPWVIIYLINDTSSINKKPVDDLM